MEIRYFVYRKKEGNKRFTHTRKIYFTLDEALQEAKKYKDGYVIGCDYTGRELTNKIYA